MKKMIVIACLLAAGAFVVDALAAGSCCPASRRKAAQSGEAGQSGEQAEGAKCGAKK